MTTEFPAVLRPAEVILAHTVEALPTLLAVIVVGLLGIVFAFLIGRLVRWAIQATRLDVLAEKAGAARLLYAMGYRGGVPELGAKLARFAAIVLTLAIVSEMLGLQAATDGIAALVAFVPQLLVAAVVLLAGLWLADISGNLQSDGDGERLVRSKLLRQIVYWTIVAVTLTVALDQLGVQTRLVNAMLLVVAGSIGVSGAIAVGLGARATVEELVGRHYASKLFHAGDVIDIGDAQGTVTAFGATTLVLSHKGEEIVVPYSLVLSRPVVRHAIERVVAPGGDAPSPTGSAEPLP